MAKKIKPEDEAAPPPPTGAQASNPRWKRVAILAVTGTESGDTWTTESLRCPNFVPGTGVQHMPPATRIDGGGNWAYEGAQLLALMRWHTHIILQHVPPIGFIRDLMNSKDSQIEEVAFWIDAESTVAAGYWSQYQKPIERLQALSPNRLHAPDGRLNRFGNDLVDPYESNGNLQDPNDWQNWESKHSWFMDMLNTNYADALAQEVAQLIYAYGTTTYAIRVFTDNCYDWQYQGTASNVTQQQMLDRGAAFIAGMQRYLSNLRKLNLGTWGNCDATEYNYPQLDLKFGELDLVETTSAAQFAGLIRDSVNRGEGDRNGTKQMYAAHPENRGQGPRWATDASLWVQLQGILEPEYQDNMMVTTARSSRYLFCPPACE